MNGKKIVVSAMLCMLWVFAQQGSCDATLDATVNTLSSWWTGNGNWGDAVINSTLTADDETAPDSSAVWKCAITATSQTVSPYYYGYIALNWGSNTPIDLSNTAGVPHLEGWG